MKPIRQLLIVALGLLASAGIAQAAGTTVYNNIPSPQPGNVPSEAFEAQSASEFGGQIQLAGTERQNAVVTVLMSSWGCQSGHWYSGDCMSTPGATFSVPITLNVYNVGPGGTVGSLIATQTKPFAIPYRPSASVSCGDGRWSTGTTCFNGFAVPISFDPLTATLPNKVIVALAYNTTHYGYAPIGEAAPCYTSAGGCGYDSLNVGVAAPPSVGTDPLPNDAYLNSSWTGAYCVAGPTGTFRLDAGCWTGFQPALKVAATVPPAGSAYGVRVQALLLGVGPTPFVSRTTPGTSASSLASVSAGALLSVKTLAVSTQIGPGAVVNSSAQLAHVGLLGSTVVADGVKASCNATALAATGTTTIAKLVVAGKTLTNITAGPNSKISILGVGTLTLNEQIPTPGGITVNALHLTLLGGVTDLIVSQAKCVI